MKDQVVLVTGASGGIGAAIAQAFVQAGAVVYGTSRKEMSVPNVRMLRMDMEEEASILEAARTLLDEAGRLDVLVNNAGMGVAGPLLDTTPQELFRQFNVNVLGAHRVTRAFREALAESHGCIVNISSVAGVVPIPFQSGYSASKYAMESLSECLRAELKPFGVRVVLVQPGDTKTAFTANRTVVEAVSPQYQKRFTASLRRMEHDEQNGMPPEAVAGTVLRAVRSKRPPVRVTVGLGYKALRTLKRFLPDRLCHFIICKLYA